MTSKKSNASKSMFPLGLKAIAYVLAFLLALYAVPINVYAEIIDAVDSALDGTSDNVDELGSAESEMPADKAVFEVIDRREETVKHFRDADGSYVAAQYNYPVHELDAKGEWQDIDNTLAESGSEYATPNARVKFAKKITGNETLFTLHDGNRKITMSLSGANKKVAGQVTNTHTEFDAEATELQKMMALDKLSSRILYPEILDDVDLEYVVQPDNIKENIIVKEKSDGYRYSFDIHLNNLAATLQEDGSVCIADPSTNEVVYVIPAGYMFDGAGEYSDAVLYELADNGNCKYTLTVTADAEWINAGERVFPVTIDPTINYNNYDYSSVVQAGHVCSNYPDSSYSGSTSLFAGYVSSLGYYYSYVQMTTLPSIPDNATITNAALQMKSFGLQDKVIPVGVYYVVTAWDRSTLTYSNRPTTHSHPVDYEGVEDTGTYNWDVTTLMRNWYDGTYENHGVMIATVNSTDARVSFNNSNSPTSAPLFIITYKDTKGIESYYSYYSSSADLAGEGRINAMTGNLTFVHSSIPTTDEILPYTVSLVYNSGLSNQFYTNTSDAIVPIANKTIGMGFKMSYDETIKILTTVKSEKMYVWADSDGTEHYFTPENYDSVNKRYRDEDGMGVYLYVESENNLGSGYQIKDDVGNIKHFNSNGYLDYILDISGNKRTFNRNSSNQVSSIVLTPKDASTITQIQMTFASGMLATITNQQTGLSARMYYSSTYNGSVSQTPSNFLRKIVYTYASGTTYTVSYEYDSSGRLITAKDLKSKMAIFYEFSSKGKVIQVAQYANATETSAISAMTLGKKATINYGALHSYYVSSKETSDTSDDVTTYYRFDPSGRVVSAHTQDANNLYGASNITYDDSTLKTQNAISSVLQIGTDTVNYLLNPGFEWANSDGVPSNWTIYGIADCTGDSNDYSNSKLRMEPTGPNNKSIASQTFKLKEGTYTASALFERRSHDTVVKSRIYIKDSSGNEVAKSNYILPFGTEATTMNLEEQASVTFTVDDSSCYTNGWKLEIVTEYIGGLNSYPTDWMLVDSVMLEKSNGASRYSSLENGGFENTTSSTSIPSWVLVGAQRSTTTRDGQYAITIPGRVSSQSYAYTTVKFMDHIPYPDATGVKTSTSENYVISGWAKAESAYTGNSYTIDDLDNTKKEPIFALKAVVHYMGMTETETVYIPFNDHCTEWQFATGVVSSKPTGDGDYYRISSIEVYGCYDYNINTAYFDNISVVENTNCVTTYSYNENGYVENAGSSDGNGVSYNYASNGIDVSNATSTDGTGAKFTYDANHRIHTETVTAKVNGVEKDQNKTTYSYDSFGNITSMTVQDLTSSGASLYSSSTFSTSSTNFGAVLTTTDANYRTNRMFYDSKARLIGMCDNAGHGLVYTYDNYGRVTEIAEATYNSTSNTMVKTSGGTTVSNVYDSSDTRGLLEKITTATATYMFEYDAFGNMTRISVNGYTLSSNTYEEKNGNLTQSIYGNQDCVKYAYDNVDRITDIWYNDYEDGDIPAYSYTYNANGDLSSHTDHVSGLVYVYMYDHRGNISQRTTKDTDDNTKSIETYKYDEHGRLIEIGYSYFNAGNAPTFTYCDYTYDELGNVKSIKHGGSGGKLQYTYDGFGRIDTEHVSHTDGTSSDIFTKNYDYSGNEVEWVWGLDKNGESYDTYYEYDAAGNITLIEITGESLDDVIQKYTYQYDSKNQLTRENLFFGSGNSANRTMVYMYDSAGNILSKKQYAYTETASVSGSPTDTYSYGYASTWKDQLTSFADESISYDAIGNPTSYGNYTYEWMYGRQLSEIKNGSTTIATFQYNDEGIRTVKTAKNSAGQDIRHEYDVVGGQINREVIYAANDAYIAKDLRYYYDASGRPVAIRALTRTSATASFTDVTYYLMTNPQGDVVAIYNANGAKIYEYAYDAWGNMIRSTAAPGYMAQGNAANEVNPFRYRGYYYDSEIGLEFYYLQSRYYNPEWGRFLNADAYVNANGDLIGYNMYAYCSNNPIMYIDSSGYIVEEATDFDHDSSDEEFGKPSSIGGQQAYSSSSHFSVHNGKAGSGKGMGIGTSKGPISSNVHGNSISSTKPQHLYTIRSADGRVQKVGISSQTLNSNGSPRANRQVNMLNRSSTQGKYYAVIEIPYISNRRLALAVEKIYANIFRKDQPMNLHRRP